jgi:hypothetical protein
MVKVYLIIFSMRARICLGGPGELNIDQVHLEIYINLCQTII